ncbi:MAG: PIN domain-containing protein [Deltaproteobacteria bacterium]|nr:PIN domain-containing protein [Deltaproteobacteria bacterium]
MDAKSIFIDTNVLIYANNRESPLCEVARGKLDELALSGNALFVSNQVIREYLVIMTRPGFVEKPISSESAIEDAKRITKEFTLLFPDRNSLDKLMELILKYQIKGKRIHDAAIASVMLTNGITDILTKNIDDFKSFQEITHCCPK